jgi:D-alanyl-D-alanine carboxypeptidase/D-alanyl-D-alanine-endopeptidase (penicillin-binding protein 4)
VSMRQWFAVVAAATLMIATAPALHAAPNPVLEPVTAENPATPAGVREAVRPLLKSKALGRVTAHVTDIGTGRDLLNGRANRAQIPGSTVKLATAAAALRVLGPDSRLATTTVGADNIVTLIGGGDATLVRARGGNPLTGGSASLKDLAVATAKQLDAGTPIRLRYDASAFTGPQLGPGWSRALVTSGNVAPVSALMVNEGRVRPGSRARVKDPARTAAQAFAALLRAEGVQVRSVRPGNPPAGARQLASVQSPPVSALVERMLTDSSNDLAESLAHLVGGKASGDPSFRGGAQATIKVLNELGIPTSDVVLVDGSGLSGRNRMPARALTAIVNAAASGATPALASITSGLAVAGVSGTLADRFKVPPTKRAAGYVRAKTGTLTGVVTLSGLVQDRQGRLMLFTIMANNVSNIPAARNAADRFAAALAACGCGG